MVWKKKTGYPQNTWIDFLRKYFGGMFAKGSAGVQPEQGKGNADKAGKGNEDLFHEVGGELVLTPDKSTVTDPITSILWKHGECWVAYWDLSGLDIYGAFKERTTLDQNTGELRISGLKKTDSGVYSVEFNSKLLVKTYKLSVINKPSGSNRPKDESKPDAKVSDGVQPEQETVRLLPVKTGNDDADKLQGNGAAEVSGSSCPKDESKPEGSDGVQPEQVGESKTDGSAAPVGEDESKTDGSAAPVGEDESKTDGSAAPVGEDESKTDGSAAPVGEDESKTDGSAAPVGEDESKTDGSAAPVGEDESKTDGSAAPVGEDESKTDGSAAPRCTSGRG
ncbi:uncharacterized protein LOC120033270 [Salvelinus namaycush]|uniref:Uncharacterized protein LOC120033270 n=1 Tax=Salvelinus namaycush TaxID=8040 RepID=A0A8U0Q270_SALNM|nr:uncharacterized protein LOC120033270 [Salvelinus namaycush]